MKFIKGNYQNKCSLCGNLFKGTDKLWFVCEPCCDKTWTPASSSPDYDGIYLGYIDKHEKCGVITFYQRTVENRLNKWVLEKDERLLYYMKLPPSPIELPGVQVSDTTAAQ